MSTEKVMAAKLDSLSVEMANQLSLARGQWLDRTMAEHVPAHVCLWAGSGDAHKRQQALRWLNRKGFTIQHSQTGQQSRICRDKQILSEFRFELKDGKLYFFERRPTGACPTTP